MNDPVPLIPFRCCPGCGHQPLAWPLPKEMRCPACGFRYFHNVAAAAGGILEQDGQVVLTIRRHDPCAGLLDYAGGFIEAGESAEAGFRREIREELGLELDKIHYIGSYANRYPFAGVTYATLDLVFHAVIPSRSTIQALDDVAGIVRFDPARLDPRQIAFASCRAALNDFYQRNWDL